LHGHGGNVIHGSNGIKICGAIGGHGDLHHFKACRGKIGVDDLAMVGVYKA